MPCIALNGAFEKHVTMPISGTAGELVLATLQIERCIRRTADCSSQAKSCLSLAFIGFSGHGKASYINTIASFSCIPPKQIARRGDQPLTTRLAPHALVVWDAASGDNQSSKIVLINTPGHFCQV